MQLTEILPRAASAYPDEEAVACGAHRLSYRELADRVGRLTAALAGLGVGPGERVALLHRNCHRVLEAYFAAVHAGAVLVPLNYRLTARDLAYILDDTDCRILIADDGWAELAAEAAQRARGPCTVVRSRVDGKDRGNASGYDYEALLEGAEPAPLVQPEAAENDPANIYYTSGTTGHQKGVVLTHRNIASHALATIAELRLTDTDVWIHVAPMFHLADAWATWAVTWAGGRHVMVGRFEPERVLRTMVDERVTVTNLIPTMLNDLVHHPQARALDFPALRLLMSGGAAIAPSLVRRVVETFGAEYVQTYGLTETSPYLTFSLLKRHQRQLPAEEQMRFRSLTGRAVLGVRLRVVDEAGEDVPADGRAVGEIVARGDRITPGYWRLPEATAEAFRDGWFHTGDLATIDPEGFVNIVDRKKDVIITGGELVYSTEVENALYEHPAVLEAAVVGVPDDRLGETVRAVVVVRAGRTATPEELITHCRARIAAYKCPRSVELVDKLPRTGSGKISKRTLREIG
ncbi:MAG: long-chain-fatty-acid--CoA ligase [bacterium]|nr:long-chain-fatty-acid--CoA ligase [bacterium]